MLNYIMITMVKFNFQESFFIIYDVLPINLFINKQISTVIKFSQGFRIELDMCLYCIIDKDFSLLLLQTQFVFFELGHILNTF